MKDAFIVRNQVALSFEGVQAVLRAAERKAREIGTPMCIAVVDAGGHLLGFSRMDGARTGNINLALTKAVSAAMRRRSTASELGLRPDDPLQSIRLTLAAGTDKLTSSRGGLPILVEDHVVGGIGVSNGKGDQDEAVAQAGIDALLSD